MKHLAAAFIALVAPVAAWAQPRDLEPSSLLVFPLIDWTVGRDTLVSITNTNTNDAPCPGGDTFGDVLAHFVYVDGENGREANRTELLRPGDTISVLASAHNASFRRGYLLVAARDPQSSLEIDFDFLVGDALLFDALRETAWDYPAIGFRSLVAETVPMAPVDHCSRALANVDGDGLLEMNGTEYDLFPDALVAPLFIEERAPFSGRLVLVSPLDAVDVDVRVTNNEGDLFATGRSFGFQLDEPLGSLSGRSRNLNGNPLELTLPGGQSLEGGWLEITSSGPVLGVFAQEIRRGFRGTAGDIFCHHGARTGAFVRAD